MVGADPVPVVFKGLVCTERLVCFLLVSYFCWSSWAAVSLFPRRLWVRKINSVWRLKKSLEDYHAMQPRGVITWFFVILLKIFKSRRLDFVRLYIKINDVYILLEVQSAVPLHRVVLSSCCLALTSPQPSLPINPKIWSLLRTLFFKRIPLKMTLSFLRFFLTFEALIKIFVFRHFTKHYKIFFPCLTLNLHKDDFPFFVS